MPDKLDKILDNRILVIMIAALVLYFIMKGQANKLLQAVGLADSPDENREQKKDEKQAIQNRDIAKTSDGWQPKFYANKNRPVGTLLMKQADLERLSTALMDSTGRVLWGTDWQVSGDNEEGIFNVFRKLPSIAAMSQLVEVFSNKFGLDLYGFLKSRLDANEWATLGEIIAKKPIYK